MGRTGLAVLATIVVFVLFRFVDTATIQAASALGMQIAVLLIVMSCIIGIAIALFWHRVRPYVVKIQSTLVDASPQSIAKDSEDASKVTNSGDWVSFVRTYITVLTGLLVALAGLVGTDLARQQNELMAQQLQASFNSELSEILNLVHAESREAEENVSADSDKALILKQRPFWRVVTHTFGPDVPKTTSKYLCLSESLAARIVSFARDVRPYRTTGRNGVSGIMSPERSKLFLSLYTSAVELKVFKGILDLSYGDFSDTRLANLDFTGMNLKNANFSGALLHDVVFDMTNLSGANFRDAIATEVSMNGTSLPAPESMSGASFESMALHLSLTSNQNWLQTAKKRGLKVFPTRVYGDFVETKAADDRDLELSEIVIKEHIGQISGAGPISTTMTAIAGTAKEDFELRVQYRGQDVAPPHLWKVGGSILQSAFDAEMEVSMPVAPAPAPPPPQ